MRNIVEIFKPIYIYGERTNYLVSDWGTVMNGTTKKELKQRLNADNYYEVTLWVNNKAVNRRIHRLVAETFLENPNNYPVVNHKKGGLTEDGQWNNCVLNLEHTTISYNTKHAYDTGLKNPLVGEECGFNIYPEPLIDKIINKLLMAIPPDIIADELGVKVSLVTSVRDGYSWKHKIKGLVFPKPAFAHTNEYTYELKFKILNLLYVGKTTKEIIERLDLPKKNKFKSLIDNIRRRNMERMIINIR